MKTCLLEFEKKLEKIDFYIEYLDIEKRLIREVCVHQEVACTLYTNQEKMKSIDKKIIEYNALIISLYGAYENFVDSVIKQYLILLTEVVNKYENLPEKLKEVHFDNSIQLIQELDKRKYSELDKKGIIKNLYSCINTGEQYIINYDALLMHSSNMWPDTINELFKGIGISDFYNKIKSLDIFIDYYKRSFDIDNKKAVIEILNSRKLDDILRPVKELIDERNRVAHSWVDSIDIDSVKDRYIELIKVICKCIYYILEKELSIYQKDFSCIEINQNEVLSGKYIIFKLETEIIRLNDKIIIEKNSDKIDFGFVKSIQVNGQNIEQSEYGQEIGVQLDYSKRLKNEYKFYLLKE